MTPSKIFDQHRFIWVKPEATDIIKRFESIGWIPPSKNPWFHEKWDFHKKGK